MLGVSLLVEITRLHSLLHYRLFILIQETNNTTVNQKKDKTIWNNFLDTKTSYDFLCIICKFNMDIVTFKFTLGVETDDQVSSNKMGNLFA